MTGVPSCECNRQKEEAILSAAPEKKIVQIPGGFGLAVDLENSDDRMYFTFDEYDVAVEFLNQLKGCEQ